MFGTACEKKEAHPTCTRETGGQSPAGKMYVIDVKDIMGSDFQVGSKTSLLSC